MPGLINAHDHLQFALHPRLADPPYRNYVEWGEDIHAKFSDVFEKHRAVPRDVRLWWGGLRNLLCGVTTVSHHDPLWAELQREDFPVRVVRDYGWGHSLGLDGDLRGRALNNTVWEAHLSCMHVKGSTSQRARRLFTLDGLGLLDASAVLVHGLAIDDEGVELMQGTRSFTDHLPLLKRLSFRTCARRDLLGCDRHMSRLGSDSPLTSEGDLLDEVRFAMQLLRHPASGRLSHGDRSPAAMLRLIDA